MSLESAKAFAKRFLADKGFQDQFLSSQDPAARKAMALAAGYSFTKEEIHEALQQLQNSTELSDEQLDGVAGGWNINSITSGMQSMMNAANFMGF